ncbi:hypothetical protein PSTT_02738 [Puccinia striiformis]|uniref:Uncharacterized protein n=1 Tax=Puccinia striiformis TaxID=27350 RepID=A0A2S4VZ79_9BASI|nr:hypothetical protein PSTT_02738 [Puccinia striiformis]
MLMLWQQSSVDRSSGCGKPSPVPLAICVKKCW